MSTTLAISHNLFLTPGERDQLLQPGGSVVVVGVSVPVWYCKGRTSEPAIEVFARYELINKQEVINLKLNDEGYEITLPPQVAAVTRLSDDVWNSLSRAEQDSWWAQHEPAPSLAMLKSLKEGGSDWLAFRQVKKVKRNKKILNLVHYVEIKMIDEIVKTLT